MQPDGPRARLVVAAVEDFAAHGAADRSLRTIAGALGTSHRMLIHHFGSREGLLAEVVAAVEAGQREALAALSADPGIAPAEVLRRMWTTVAADAVRYGPLFFEFSAAAMRGRTYATGLADTLVEPWLAPLAAVFRRAGVGSDESVVRARLAVGTARGLLHDALVTGEPAAAGMAMDAFAALATTGGGGPAGAPGPEGER